jgi:hypothetical protein
MMISVARERCGKLPLAERSREIVDELGRGDEERIEAVLDGAIGNGDRKMCLAAARFAVQDQTTSLGDEVGREGGAQQCEAQRGLESEVKLVDRLQERKLCPAR